MATKPDRKKLIQMLQDMAQLMKILGENDFKIRAFEKGAGALEASEAGLDDIARGKIKVAGIGDGLKSAIREFLEDGDIKAHAELSAKVPAGVIALLEIPGLGPKKAMMLHEELGVATIGELEYACRENRLISIKGFGPAMQEKVLKSIEQWKQSQGKLLLDAALELYARIEKKLHGEFKGAAVRAVGQLGRYREIIEHLEVVVSGKVSVAAAKEALAGFLDDSAERDEHGLHAITGVFKDGVRLTLWISPQEPDANLLLWLMADEILRPRLASDAAAFHSWEFTWLESEWTGRKRNPSADAYRVGRDGGVRGIFHNHTNFSDGRNTLEQMVRAAEKLGFEYIGISDHSQSAFYAHGLKPDRIREQRKLIGELQKGVSIRIFHGVESDILADGALDYDRDVLESFDFIVGSVHSRFKLDEKEMTARLVRALSHPAVTIWGHPTGRLVLGRAGYALDWDACLAAAAKNGVAVELNAHPQRLDVDWRMGAELERREVSICINPDAHSVEGLSDTRIGERIAEKSMIPRHLILNRRGVSEMEKYLWQRKKRLKAS
ncbi:MAG: PHP domain-containing protein [Deltaproteobacteria bacterium]|nr:PHP domain-containing protein [Deltaproteobacteria bacterium]